MFEMFSLLLSPFPAFSWISAVSEEIGYNLSDMLKSPHVVSVEIYLPKATRPDPSPPPPPSFCLYPSTKLVPVKKDVPVIFLSSLLLFLILFSLSAIHKATLNMLKWGKM